MGEGAEVLFEGQGRVEVGAKSRVRLAEELLGDWDNQLQVGFELGVQA